MAAAAKINTWCPQIVTMIARPDALSISKTKITRSISAILQLWGAENSEPISQTDRRLAELSIYALRGKLARFGEHLKEVRAHVDTAKWPAIRDMLLDRHAAMQYAVDEAIEFIQSSREQ